MTSFPEFPKDAHDFSAAEVGQALAGLVARDGAGLPVPGMLAAPAVTAVAASWKVQVGRFVYVRNVSGSARFSGLSASEQVDIANALTIPGGQARIDLVRWNPVTSALSVVTGAPATSPVVPSAGGQVPVATVRVTAGDAQVIAGQVRPAYTLTGLADSQPVEYVPVVSGYSAGFAPEMRAQFSRSGDVYDVELQAVTDRDVVRVTGPILVTTPVPIGATPVAVDGGGYFLAGPTGAKSLYEAKVRHASINQVVIEFVRVNGTLAELVALSQTGLVSPAQVSWRVRFRFTAGA